MTDARIAAIHYGMAYKRSWWNPVSSVANVGVCEMPNDTNRKYHDTDGDEIADERVYDFTMGGLTAPMRGKDCRMFIALAQSVAERNATHPRQDDK